MLFVLHCAAKDRSTGELHSGALLSPISQYPVRLDRREWSGVGWGGVGWGGVGYEEGKRVLE